MKNYKTAICLLVFLWLFGCGGEDSPEGSNPDNITFTAEPVAETDHNRLFQFTARATHKNGDPLTYDITAPGWLNYDEPLNKVSGIPDWNNLNQSFRVVVMATNGIDTAIQRSDVRVVLGEINCDASFGLAQNSPYVLPFGVGSRFKVNQTYCPSNPNWGHFNWFAYDFEMPIGTPILAMRAGTVRVTQSHKEDNVLDCGPNSGNFVFIDHDDGTLAQYQHLKQNGVLVEAGDRVEQGQQIALSGNSGCSAGPHLHVNIYRQKGGPYIRQYTLPFNFSNADGPLNSRRGLIQDGVYTAF